MTVSELIEKLGQYPEDAKVLVKNDCESWIEIEPEYDETTNEILL